MKPIIVCLILSLVVANGWPSRQLDVNSAFLQGTLTDNVFMQQPPGFVNPSTLTMFVTSKRLFMAYVKHHRLGTMNFGPSSSQSVSSNPTLTPPYSFNVMVVMSSI